MKCRPIAILPLAILFSAGAATAPAPATAR